MIGAKPDEFDLDRAIWTIPAERMKAGKEHKPEYFHLIPGRTENYVLVEVI